MKNVLQVATNDTKDKWNYTFGNKETNKFYYMLTTTMKIIQKKNYGYIPCESKTLTPFKSSQCDNNFTLFFTFQKKMFIVIIESIHDFPIAISINETLMVTIEIWLSISMENYYNSE